MCPPSEIVVVNASGVKFRAHFTGLYNWLKRTYQYRVHIPGVEISLVTVEFGRKQLRDHLHSQKPIPIVPING